MDERIIMVFLYFLPPHHNFCHNESLLMTRGVRDAF
jgi:hypothetical protein